MDNFNKAKELAENAGYKPKVWAHISDKEKLLDPDWWVCLGKALGDGKSKVITSGGEPVDSISVNVFSDGSVMERWKVRWHRFIDHLAEGKDVDEFFKDLIK